MIGGHFVFGAADACTALGLPLALTGDWVTPFWRVVTTVAGLMVGSFLNVVVWRLPRGLSLAQPPSACPGCEQRIRWFDNLPVLSWLLLRGRCRRCKMSISARYPLVEALTGALFYLTAVQYGGDAVSVVVVCLALAALVAISFIDLDHRIIPDVISLPGVVVGLATAPFIGIFASQHPGGFLVPGTPWLDALVFSLLGAVIGAGVVLLVRALGSFVLKKEAMGLGDVKLLAMIGAFVGPTWVLYALVLACFGGAIIGGAMFLIARGRALPCDGVVSVDGHEVPFEQVLVRDQTLVFAGAAPAAVGAAANVCLTFSANRVLTDDDVPATFEGKLVPGAPAGSFAVELAGPFADADREAAFYRLDAFSDPRASARARFFLVLAVAFGVSGVVALMFGQPLLLQISGLAALFALALFWLRRPRARPCRIEAKAKGKAMTVEGARLDDGVLVFDAPRRVAVGARVSLVLELPGHTIGEGEDATVAATGKVLASDDREGGSTWHVALDAGYESEPARDAYELLTTFGMSARYIPFGPFLSLAGAAMLLFGAEVAWFIGTGYPEWTRGLMGTYGA